MFSTSEDGRPVDAERWKIERKKDTKEKQNSFAFVHKIALFDVKAFCAWSEIVIESFFLKLFNGT